MKNIKNFNKFVLNEDGLNDMMYKQGVEGHLYRYNNENPSIELEDTIKDDQNYMILQNLEKILNSASDIKRKIKMGYKLEEWAKDHLSTSADDIQEIIDSLS